MGLISFWVALAAVAGQDAKASEAALQAFIREADTGMRSENADERLKALRSTFPTRKDVETLFPAQAEKLWAFYERAFKRMESDLPKTTEEFTRGGALKSVTLIDVRTGSRADRFKAVLDMMPKDVPVYDYVKHHESRSAGGGSFVFVNGRWALFRGLVALPSTLDKLK